MFFAVMAAGMGINFHHQDVMMQHIAVNCSVKADNTVNYSLVDARQQFISESENGMPNICEKNNFSCRIVSVVVRLLPTTVLFKELHAKHILKNKFFIREAVADICFSLKQQDGFYTYGVGYLRI